MIRKLKNARAQRVLTAASEEFARRGFEGGRIEEIAKRAGVNKQLVFYYYHSKRGLFQAVISAAARELEQALVGLTIPEGRPLDRIRRALEAQFDYMARKPELVALLSQGGRAEGASFAPAIKRVVVLLAEGQGRGDVRDDLDPHVAAAQALVLMVGYLRHEGVIAASAPPLIADEPALRERWRNGVVDLVVNGVRA
jgi:AcrR family transcriptional regulator